MIDKAIKQIEELFNSDLTDYRISKDTGITLSVIQKYRNDTNKIENSQKIVDFIEYQEAFPLFFPSYKIDIIYLHHF